MSEPLETLLSQTTDIAEFNQKTMAFIAERTALIQQLTASGEHAALTNLHIECQADILRWQDQLKRLSDMMSNVEKTKQYLE